MGKSKKGKAPLPSKNVPLDQQINESNVAKVKSRNKIRKHKDGDEEYIDSGLSKKILSVAREQQKELEESQNSAAVLSLFTHPAQHGSDSEDEEDIPDHDEPDLFYESIDVDEEEERALRMFMSQDPKPTRTLADIIMDKITEKQTELQTIHSDAGDILLLEVDPRVRQLYEGVRDVLKRYRSGKLPKAFKMIPNLRNWEQLLYITEPTSWSAASVYQATRIFASNLTERMAQRFYNLVLLPRIRDDIAEYKKINFHLYQALTKALYKPGAFMKGILLPLLESGDCTLRESIIIGSVLARNSVPIMHSCAALLKVAEMDYTGANSIILRMFFDKKYALPYRVIDSAVFHFLRFERDSRELPVLWHQSLLTFIQRYKADLSLEQRDGILFLLRKQSHPTISAEIRRELHNSICRELHVPTPSELGSEGAMITD